MRVAVEPQSTWHCAQATLAKGVAVAAGVAAVTGVPTAPTRVTGRSTVLTWRITSSTGLVLEGNRSLSGFPLLYGMCFPKRLYLMALSRGCFWIVIPVRLPYWRGPASRHSLCPLLGVLGNSSPGVGKGAHCVCLDICCRRWADG